MKCIECSNAIDYTPGLFGVWLKGKTWCGICDECLLLLNIKSNEDLTRYLFKIRSAGISLIENHQKVGSKP